MNSPKRIEAISKARKKIFSSGKWDNQLENLRKPRSKKTKDKISRGAKGVPKPKPQGFGTGRIHSNVTKDKMSKTHIHKWVTGDIGERKFNASKLEKTFAGILDLLDIEYQTHYYAKEIKAFYDF